jgi:hypothetical protein
MLTRRALFKWSLIGGLIAFPMGLTVYRKLKDGSYQYVYEGPLEEGEPTLQIKDLGGTGWLKDNYDISRWSGKTSGKIYIPDSMYVDYSGERDKYYTISVTFGVNDSAPADLKAECQFDAISKGTVVLTDTGIWGVPQKRKGKMKTNTFQNSNLDRVEEEWEKYWGEVPSMPFVTTRLSFHKTDFMLQNIDKLVVTIRELRIS